MLFLDLVADDLKVLLIKRDAEPFKDMWALPGAMVNPDEDLDEAPQRILLELTGLTNVFLEQVHTFGKVSRHPQGRVITVAYYSLVNIENAHDQFYKSGYANGLGEYQ